MLDDDWTVSTKDDTLFLCKASSPLNPIIERAITWHSQKLNLLVHNHQVPSRHSLWHMNRKNPINCGELADMLVDVSKRFLNYEVCDGVQTHDHLWDRYQKDGHIETNTESPCLRSKDCYWLLIFPGTCTDCRHLQRRMVDSERKRLKTTAKAEVDKSKTNNRYLQREELLSKVNRIEKEKKLSNQSVRRLTKRINQLIAQKSTKIDSELGNDFISILNQNTDKMTSIEKLFWQQQSLALSKRKKMKTMRWHSAMIRLALHLRMLSPAAFDFMSGILSLPSARRLFDYSQFTEIKEGLQEDLLEQLRKMISETCSEENLKFFSLLLDEMSIRSGLVYSGRTNQLIGFVNLTSLEAELAALDAEIQGKEYEPKLAKKVLVFMLTGCVNDIIFIAAVYSTDDLSATQLYSRAWDVIYAAEEAGAKVLTVIFDGASVNRKFIKMNFNSGNKDVTYVTVNPASGESRLLYFILDPPHLLKTSRNCSANSCSHRMCRLLCNNDEILSWKAIEALFGLHEKYKPTRLTKAHVYLTSFSCMKVFLAAQLFSNSVADALEKWKHLSPLKEHYSDELVKFIRLMNRWFDCMNGGERSKKKETNPDLLEYTSVIDPRFEFLEDTFLPYLDDWQTFVDNRVGNYTKTERSNMIISRQSLEAMKITVHSFIGVTRFLLEAEAPQISSRKLSQDCLEQYFASIRRARGSDNNPTLKQFLHTRLSLAAQKNVTSQAKRGNTEVQEKEIEVDSSPLPVRKKFKKQ